MKKTMDKLKSKIKTNKKFSIFLFVLILVGAITGALFLTILSNTDKELICDYLNSYITSIKTKQPDYVSIFFNSILNSSLTAIAIWLLGLSVVGIPVMLFLFFCKAFTLGFSVASIFLVYHINGSLFALFSIFPHQIINLLAYGILMIYALSVSIKMIEAVLKKKNFDFKTIMGKYSLILGFSLFLLLLGSIYETFALQNLLKFIIPFLK